MLTIAAGILLFFTFDISGCEPEVYTLEFADNHEKQINQENYERLNPEDHSWPVAKYLKEIKELNMFCYSFLQSHYKPRSSTYESSNLVEDLLVKKEGNFWKREKPIPHTFIRCGNPGWAGYEVQLSPAFGSTCVFESTLKKKELVLHGVHCNFYKPGKITSYYDINSLNPAESWSPQNSSLLTPFGYLSDISISDLEDVNRDDMIPTEDFSPQNSSPTIPFDGNLSDISISDLEDLDDGDWFPTESLSPQNSSRLTSFRVPPNISNSGDLKDLDDGDLFSVGKLSPQNSSPQNSSLLTHQFGYLSDISISDLEDLDSAYLFPTENLNLEGSSPPTSLGNLSDISISDLEEFDGEDSIPTENQSPPIQHGNLSDISISDLNI